MKISYLEQNEIAKYIELGLVSPDLNRFEPIFDPQNNGRATIPYCPQAEYYWESVRGDSVLEQAMYVIPYFNPETNDGERTNLIEQEAVLLRVIYKAFHERNGLAVFPDGKLQLVTPPVLGVTPNNEAVMVNWPSKGDVASMNEICAQARAALKQSLFTLSVRTLNTRWDSIKVLEY